MLGHSVAVTDVASGFAAELIAAYPNAKVVLNYRKDLDAWHRSTMRTILHMSNRPESYTGALLTRKGFWNRHFFLNLLYPGLFRSPDGSCQTGIAKNGKRAHQGKQASRSCVVGCLYLFMFILIMEVTNMPTEFRAL